VTLDYNIARRLLAQKAHTFLRETERAHIDGRAIKSSSLPHII